MTTLESSQMEMRNKHMYGATGIITSWCIWLATSIVALSYSEIYAIVTLLIGGALIHPISTWINKIFTRTWSHADNNPLNNLGMEWTFFMLMCIPLAYGLSLVHTEWFFQGMLMIIGGRYLIFNTIFWNRLFWILGATLGIAAYILFSIHASSFLTTLTGSVIEIVFWVFIYLASVRKQ